MFICQVNFNWATCDVTRAGLVELTMAEELLARKVDLRHCSGVGNNNMCSILLLRICLRCAYSLLNYIALAFVEICLLARCSGT